LYYEPLGESALNLELMRLLDEQYTRTPFFGVPKMTDALRKQGYAVNPKRVRRLLRQMGLEAIYPKPRLSEPVPGHRIYPYRLRHVVITRPDQVWSAVTHHYHETVNDTPLAATQFLQQTELPEIDFRKLSRRAFDTADSAGRLAETAMLAGKPMQ